jgi:hypothetical protein
MSLNDPTDNQPQTASPQQPTPTDQPAPQTSNNNLKTSKPQKPSNELYLKTLKIAEKYKGKSWNSAKDDIMKEAGCSRSTAYRAHREVNKPLQEASKTGKAQKAGFTVAQEKSKDPEFLKQTPQQPLEELPDTPTQIADQPVDQEYFKDLLRGVHAAFLSEEGVLGKKYGRPISQCNTTSDQLYRYITKRVPADQLENYDTVLLATSYLALLAPILKTALDERKKKADQEAKEKRAP